MTPRKCVHQKARKQCCTRAHPHDCKQTRKQTDAQHNAGSKCQIPRQWESQTRESMFNANRRLAVGTGAQDGPTKEQGRCCPVAEPSTSTRTHAACRCMPTPHHNITNLCVTLVRLLSQQERPGSRLTGIQPDSPHTLLHDAALQQLLVLLPLQHLFQLAALMGLATSPFPALTEETKRTRRKSTQFTKSRDACVCGGGGGEVGVYGKPARGRRGCSIKLVETSVPCDIG